MRIFRLLSASIFALGLIGFGHAITAEQAEGRARAFLGAIGKAPGSLSATPSPNGDSWEIKGGDFLLRVDDATGMLSLYTDLSIRGQVYSNRFSKEQLIAHSRTLAEKVNPASARWEAFEITFDGGEKSPRSDMFRKGSVHFAPTVNGFRTGGRGDSVEVVVYLADGALAAVVARSGRTYEEPAVAITESAAIELATAVVNKQIPPKSTSLAYYRVGTGYGGSGLAPNMERTLKVAYCVQWSDCDVIVDAQSGQISGGGVFGGAHLLSPITNVPRLPSKPVSWSLVSFLGGALVGVVIGVLLGFSRKSPGEPSAKK